MKILIRKNLVWIRLVFNAKFSGELYSDVQARYREFLFYLVDNNISPEVNSGSAPMSVEGLFSNENAAKIIKWAEDNEFVLCTK